MMDSKIKTQVRLHFLDALRGLAALYVVLFHLLMIPGSPVHLNFEPLVQFVRFGGTGVFLFFDISGFSLSMTMKGHDATGMPLLSYGISRFFRIAPLFYFMITFMAARELLLYGNHPGPKTALLNFSFLFNLFPGKQEGIVMASWTIGVETLFYLMFIPLFKAGWRWQIAAVAICQILFVTEASFLPDSYYYLSALGYVPMFIVGMLAFPTFEHLKLRIHAREIGMQCIVGSIAILGVCAAFPMAQHDVNLRMPIAIGYAVLLVGCGLRPPKIAKSAIFQLYGRISYSVYLIHAVILITFFDSFSVAAAHTPTWLSELLPVLWTPS